jgi:hypothetical protein
MTARQRITLNADWWPAACRAQGWKSSNRDLRLRVCAWSVSLENPTQLELLQAINSDAQPKRWLESTNDLDNTVDVDRVKACLLMLADDVAKTQEVGKPKIGSARRKRDVLRDLIKCIGVYFPRPRAYVAEIINDKFNGWRKYGAPLTIKDLTDDPIILKDGRELPSQLDQLLYTVAACLNGSGKLRGKKRSRLGFRVAAGDTLHGMKMKAGVFCDCAACTRAGLRPAEPTEEENWSDFEPELEMAVDEFGGTGGEEGDPF